MPGFDRDRLKQLNSSVHFQNCCAYSYGCLFNFAYMLINPTSNEIITRDGILGNYNLWTWAYVFCTATMGLSVSFMYK